MVLLDRKAGDATKDREYVHGIDVAVAIDVTVLTGRDCHDVPTTVYI